MIAPLRQEQRLTRRGAFPVHLGENPIELLVEGRSMNIVSCSLRDELSVDFSRARAQLAEARLRQDKKDTSANRAAVAECWTRIDAILDMYLLDSNFQEEKCGCDD